MDEGYFVSIPHSCHVLFLLLQSANTGCLFLLYWGFGNTMFHTQILIT